MKIIKKAAHSTYVLLICVMMLLSGMSLQAAQVTQQPYALPITVQVKEIKDDKGNVVNYDVKVTHIAYPQILEHSQLLQDWMSESRDIFIQKATKRKELENSVRSRQGLRISTVPYATTVQETIDVLVSPAILALLEKVITAFTRQLQDVPAAQKSVQTVPTHQLLELVQGYTYLEITIPVLYNALFERLANSFKQHLKDNKIDLKKLHGYASDNEAELASSLSALFKGSDIRLMRELLEKIAYRDFVLLHTLAGHLDGVLSVTYNTDGKSVASGSNDATVKIWDALTGTLKQTLQKGLMSGGVYSVAYSPDGKSIAAGLFDTDIQIWDLLTDQLRQTLQGGNLLGVLSVSYSPDGKHLVSGSSTIQIWDTLAGNLQRTLKEPSRGVLSVSYSPDGKFIVSSIVSGTSNNIIKIWGALTGELKNTLQGHTNFVRSVIYSPDGKYIASGSDDATVKIWDALTGELKQTLQGHTAAVNSVDYSPDGQYIASGSSDKTIKIWQQQSLGKFSLKKLIDYVYASLGL